MARAPTAGRPHMPEYGLSDPSDARLLNPYCVIHPESADEAVIIEGVVEVVENEAALAPFRETYSRKYGMDPTQIPGTIYAVRPRIVFGFIEKAEEFPMTATRWIFA